MDRTKISPITTQPADPWNANSPDEADFMFAAASTARGRTSPGRGGPRWDHEGDFRYGVDPRGLTSPLSLRRPMIVEAFAAWERTRMAADSHAPLNPRSRTGPNDGYLPTRGGLMRGMSRLMLLVLSLGIGALAEEATRLRDPGTRRSRGRTAEKKRAAVRPGRSRAHGYARRVARSDSPDCHARLASATLSGESWLGELKGGRRDLIRRGPTGSCEFLAFSPDGRAWPSPDSGRS